MSPYEQIRSELAASPKTWLVTGVAGFIGSNLLEVLLALGQRVVGLDNFCAGKRGNLDEVRALAGPDAWRRFQMIEADIGDAAACRAACRGADYVLHQAALGSVPRSLGDPLGFHASNATGFLNLLVAARDAGVKRFVYASSSAVYGDDPELPKIEERIGHLLSPYAATKLVNEVYADTFARAYGFASVGLRYFNVFGPRQDPEGAYAAVIPKWIASLLRREPVFINGDGETTRDFCFISNVVQANLLAATTARPEAANQVYNVALGKATTLNGLFRIVSDLVREQQPELAGQKPVYREFRPGDIRHSCADIAKARRLLGYTPTDGLQEGLASAFGWYRRSAG